MAVRTSRTPRCRLRTESLRGGEVERWAQRQRHLIVLTITNQLRGVGPSWTGSTNVIQTSWQSHSSWEVMGPVLDYKLQTSHRTSAPTSSWQLASQEASSNHQLQVIYASWQIENGHNGILQQTNFYRLNLVFWIVMGCGIAHFGRGGLKPPILEN